MRFLSSSIRRRSKILDLASSGKLPDGQKVLAVVGATGSGKTAMAVELAKKYNGILISADSRQVYKGLDIGTNKEGRPTTWSDLPSRELDGIPQLLVDIVDPEVRFTLADWLTEAKRLLQKATDYGCLPILVGGTGLYVTALFDGWAPGDGRNSKKKVPVEFDYLVLQIDVERSVLNEKSDRRFERIFDALVNETKQLLDRGVSAEWLEVIGLDYRYAKRFLSGELLRDQAIADFQQASRQYIRRQLTWWRHHGRTHSVKDLAQAESVLKDFLHPVM